jgi:predicted nucleic acid-binding protein
MTAPVFVDTNVLVYARDAAAGPRQAAALRWMAHLWQTREGRLSHQVLAEFYVTVTAKLRPGMSADAARRDVRALAAWRPIPVDSAVMEGAWLLQDRFGLSWWDALIAGSAQAAECPILLSEDFQAGQDFGGVRVVSPFEAVPRQVLKPPLG